MSVRDESWLDEKEKIQAYWRDWAGCGNANLPIQYVDDDGISMRVPRGDDVGSRQRELGKRKISSSFFPATARHQVIYAVCIVDHDGVVKVGQTHNWKKRRKSYSCWDLRSGDGISEERVFLINEEYVDLLSLESEILCRARSMFPIYRGLEWFKAEIDEVCELIDRVMCEGDISYSEI